ncbi:hypothetical protein RZS08_36865, partial [Arthrospira platensis SPKY1]|nr:hypothetical protein [Arthrospira platensis SPKY1]
MLVRSFRNPQCVAEFGVQEWSWLIRQARNADLLGQLRLVLDEAGVLDTAPRHASTHLDIAWQ